MRVSNVAIPKASKNLLITKLLTSEVQLRRLVVRWSGITNPLITDP